MSLVLLRSPTPKPARIIGSKRPPIVYPPRLSSTYQPPNSYTLPHTDANEVKLEACWLARQTPSPLSTPPITRSTHKHTDTTTPHRMPIPLAACLLAKLTSAQKPQITTLIACLAFLSASDPRLPYSRSNVSPASVPF
ncbi:hypothetical protein CPAR01_04488 [Colletotrichum paranaense]|uniref:Uncharacterized protein n=1 Tax=Colletotrichum paranaense TaxID=1914294 RepID=A0ABQ9SWG7_9PEZI|nr:uncharacterized protein CPAR01_04488 [Colletotrichum paranaense]KAK1543855.1 hypothetical protein CPAR01_04488 [Colletotrichum paranaense]